MPTEQCDKVLAAIAAQPWAIIPEALEQIIAIAERGFSDPAAALAMREERGDPGAAERRARTAVIPVFGPIFPRASGFNEISGATSVARISGFLDAALADPQVGAIVLNIDSPGGQVTGIRELAGRIRAADAMKPVTAYVSGMAASAAYWVASAARRIVAERTGVAGSIGVLCAWTDDSAAKRSQGLRDYIVVSSQTPKKHVDPKSSEGLGEIQRHVDAVAAIFIGDVAEHRGVDADVVTRDFGRGGVMLAEDALTAGLIDAIGTLEQAIDTAHAAERRAPLQTKGNAMGFTDLTAAARPKNSGEDDKPNDEEEREGRAAADDQDDEEEQEASADSGDGGGDDDEEEAEEEDGDEEKQAKRRKAIKKAKAEHPAVFRLAYRAGIRDERARIRAIHDLGLTGNDKLAEKAMFDAPMTAESVALAVMRREKARRSAAGRARLEESGEIRVGADMVDPAARVAESEEKAVIAAMAGKLPLV